MDTFAQIMELIDRHFEYTYIIGLTGGVGAGKSTVSRICEERFDMRVITTDDVAREQMKKGGVSYNEVVREFGTEILCEDGEIDRAKLAGVIFNDPQKRLRLNEITHPNVINYTLDEIKREREIKRNEFVLIETAIIFEAGMDSVCDSVWYVYAPEYERRERLKRSRGYSDQKIDSIFLSQKSEEEFCALCDSTIVNSDSSTHAEIIRDVDEAIRKLKQKSELR